jgi:hypothetical protein
MAKRKEVNQTPILLTGLFRENDLETNPLLSTLGSLLAIDLLTTSAHDTVVRGVIPSVICLFIFPAICSSTMLVLVPVPSCAFPCSLGCWISTETK